ncbi:cation diffusion facilitator family transporter [bacterium]|jgi:cation diffusion facilitator family transporter|nr:cation diffusion facilitator family transporter [bacterium]MBT4250895.1 cation diffusion facilitator family transporter [bacterium]MBT4597785.1 cation diffusion facilitator family transporter [bacterium]MBT6753366.1 cation diffusion facilitator family transporter [bacterium]MBT7037216.1 cation diffusion facilitator family transporter [bacterium]
MGKTKKVKIVSAEKAVVVSFLVDISDVVINLIVAVMSGSVVMISQVLQGFADLVSSGLLILGVKRAKLPRDKRHPYGHGRELYFWTFLSTLFTFTITAVVSFYLGLQRFINPQPISQLFWAYLVLSISVFTNGYATWLSLRRLLRKKHLSKLWSVFTHGALIETKTSLVLDLTGVMASILGIITLLLYQITGDARWDGLGAMLIAVILGLLDIYLIKRAKELLVGRSASTGTERRIKNAIKSFSEVEEVLDLRTLHIGPEKLMVNVEVDLVDQLTTDEIEILIDRIEEKIKKRVPSAANIQIELETSKV